jgi:hypothetical protein
MQVDYDVDCARHKYLLVLAGVRGTSPRSR